MRKRRIEISNFFSQSIGFLSYAIVYKTLKYSYACELYVISFISRKQNQIGLSTYRYIMFSQEFVVWLDAEEHLPRFLIRILLVKKLNPTHMTMSTIKIGYSLKK